MGALQDADKSDIVLGLASSPGIGFIIAAAVEIDIVVDGISAIPKLTAAIGTIEHSGKQMLFLKHQMLVGYVAIVADGAEKQISAIAGILRLDTALIARVSRSAKNGKCFLFFTLKL